MDHGREFRRVHRSSGSMRASLHVLEDLVLPHPVVLGKFREDLLQRLALVGVI